MWVTAILQHFGGLERYKNDRRRIETQTFGTKFNQNLICRGPSKLRDLQVGEPRDTVDALHGDAAGDRLHQPPHVLRELDRDALRVGRWLGFGRPLKATAVRSDIGSRVLRVDSSGVVSFAISCSRFASVLW